MLLEFEGGSLAPTGLIINRMTSMTLSDDSSAFGMTGSVGLAMTFNAIALCQKILSGRI
jgi:hypothetical protein